MKDNLSAAVKSPLRYPGGKSKALKTILPLVPAFSEFREPFVGGGSLYLALRQQRPKASFWINDLNAELYHFWLYLRDCPDALISGVQQQKDAATDGRALHRSLVGNVPGVGLQRAIRFFLLNRITFSGTVEAGGYSQGAFEKRFTQSSVERLRRVAPLLSGTTITNFDYEEVVCAPSAASGSPGALGTAASGSPGALGGEDVFIFLDPPYLSATKSKLYGKKGKLHTSFDHERFAAVMRDAPHKWLITYDDCEEVRALFSFAHIIPWELQYGMNNYKQKGAAKGKEVMIANYLL